MLRFLPLTSGIFLMTGGQQNICDLTLIKQIERTFAEKSDG
jgi:hypothetical protein